MSLLKVLHGLAFAGLFAAVGCTTDSTANRLVGESIPYNGKPMSASVWSKATVGDPTPGSTTTLQRKNFYWLLPTASYRRFLTVAPDKKSVSATRLSVNSVLSLLLPLHLGIKRHEYTAPDTAPTATRRLLWTPFYTTSRAKGELQNGKLEFDSAGVPIIYSSTGVHWQEDGLDLRGRVRQSLWLFGPGYVSARGSGFLGDPPNGVQPTREDSLRAWFPVGIRAFVFWSSYDAHVADTSTGGAIEQLHLTGHGPIAGFGGYFFGSKRVGDQTSNFRHILLGALWHDVVTRTNGELKTGRHGPLWSAFGWGHRDGKFNVRVFWLPIG